MSVFFLLNVMVEGYFSSSKSSLSMKSNSSSMWSTPGIGFDVHVHNAIRQRKRCRKWNTERKRRKGKKNERNKEGGREMAYISFEGKRRILTITTLPSDFYSFSRGCFTVYLN